MKFRFLGDLDAPEWFLREIMTLSRMTYVRIKLLTMHIAQNICGGPMDYDKVKLLVSTAEMTPSDIKATLTTIRYTLVKATQYATEPRTLGDELAQLGLPNEHSMAMMRVYENFKERLTNALSKEVLELGSANIDKWRVDLVLAIGGSGKRESNESQLNCTPTAKILMEVKDAYGNITTEKLTASEETISSMLFEMKKALALMETAGSI